mmetsp:Transcript_121144/g.302336  ORF Transcript_121144/g.302336 Transcript_121144/m.302336 type:complete len:372 (+) Transcript_121144:673-1788(+)
MPLWKLPRLRRPHPPMMPRPQRQKEPLQQQQRRHQLQQRRRRLKKRPVAKLAPKAMTGRRKGAKKTKKARKIEIVTVTAKTEAGTGIGTGIGRTRIGRKTEIEIATGTVTERGVAAKTEGAARAGGGEVRVGRDGAVIGRKAAVATAGAAAADAAAAPAEKRAAADVVVAVEGRGRGRGAGAGAAARARRTTVRYRRSPCRRENPRRLRLHSRTLLLQPTSAPVIGCAPSATSTITGRRRHVLSARPRSLLRVLRHLPARHQSTVRRRRRTRMQSPGRSQSGIKRVTQPMFQIGCRISCQRQSQKLLRESTRRSSRCSKWTECRSDLSLERVVRQYKTFATGVVLRSRSTMLPMTRRDTSPSSGKSRKLKR